MVDDQSDDYLSDDSMDGSDNFSITISPDEMDDVAEESPSEVHHPSKDSGPKNSLRTLMFMILVVVTIFGVLGIYGFGRSIERNEFDDGFESIARRIIDGLQVGTKRKQDSLESLCQLFATSAQDDSMQWPFISLGRPTRDLEVHRKLAGFEAVFFMPIVSQIDRKAWERYAYEYSGWTTGDGFAPYEAGEALYIKDKAGKEKKPGPYVPQWQYSPIIPNKSIVNFNWRTLDGFVEEFKRLRQGRKVLSHVWTFDPALNVPSSEDSVHFRFMEDMFASQPDYVVGEPVSFMSAPVFEDPDDTTSRVVGVVTAALTWRSLFENMFQESIHGVVCVVRNTFEQVFTLEVNGNQVEFVGFGDHHETKYENMMRMQSLNFTNGESDDYVTYSMQVYPSAKLEPAFLTAKPAIYGAVLFVVFAFASLIFISYDCFVESRQRTVEQSADQARALVNSLFPEVVGNRLLEEQGLQQGNDGGNPKNVFGGVVQPKAEVGTPTNPIAEFFVDTTIMFADIKGFTAWSSSREPAKVFILLESIFGSFDKLAKKRRIFKIETVGDCYVAVSGLPEPRKDHAVAMARFAFDCLVTMKRLVVDLEKELGPGTSDLEIRVGLNSGPVTAGVLRGEKTRFQLFGDTVNTAARMESTGQPGRIHLSETTAKLILDAGKISWVKARQDTVHAKGKGQMNTFWLDLSHRASHDRSTSGGSSTGSFNGIEENVTLTANETNLTRSNHRLVEWNVEVLKSTLKKIVAKRTALGVARESVPRHVELEFADELEAFHKTIEVMEFVPYSPSGCVALEKANQAKLDTEVERQLFDYVVAIAHRYRDNHFHSFAHCSHVLMSVGKLLTRIVTPRANSADTKSTHESSYGLSSDPLAQFACLLAALVHDAEHEGVSNDELMKSRPSLAKEYNYSSVAEKVSLDLAWSLLMEDRFDALRQAIYCNEAEYRRFRQLMVNSVLATDVLDPTLKNLRNLRWKNAFSEEEEAGSSLDNLNRKASVVIQHMMEASDVAHCMQHWHVYRKWNCQLFFEISKAYRDGRCGKDPETFWYRSELAFFDKWIIPLAQKLQQCKAFGVSSDEYLDYALQNRAEWERRGKEELADMVAKFKNLCESGQ